MHQALLLTLCWDCAAQVTALHALGPDYQSTFSPLESDAALEQMPAAAALVVDGKEALGPRLIISYNAQVRTHLVHYLFYRGRLA